LQVSDQELLRTAAGGDDDAFHALVDRHARDLFRVAMSLSHNRNDAEDLLQETFLGAYRSMKNFEGRSSVRTWLTQILTRQAAKAWHKSRHARASVSLSGAQDGAERDDLAPASDASVRSTEQRLDVKHVLAGLSPQHREVLVLREVQGLSYEEIAATLGVPRGTVESRLSRARAEFRQKAGEPLSG